MPAKKRQIRPLKRSADLNCQHTTITVSPSFHASEVHYNRPSAAQRARAQGLNPQHFEERPFTYPAPLVLPGDELALDPKYPGQSLASWMRLKHRNKVTPQKKTVYVVEPPSFDTDVDFAKSWTVPSGEWNDSKLALEPPNVENVAEYISAFYHPLPVKLLPSSTFKFISWSASELAALKKEPSATSKVISSKPVLIGLQIPSNEAIGIRTRRKLSSPFSHQLNLNDCLEAAIASLPDDAYALVMLVHHDLYEDDDDEFVCGRAYGGSRVAVVSVARYNPVLDESLGLDLDHTWPLSHCADFMAGFMPKKRKTKETMKAKDEKVENTLRLVDAANKDPPVQLESSDPKILPIQAAVDAALEFQMKSSHESSHQSARWLSRVCLTATHELNHCFGLDHCTSYACSMQGSASLKEDARQPPYLCPIDLTKVLNATGATESQHHANILAFCDRYSMRSSTLAAFAAWLRARLSETGT